MLILFLKYHRHQVATVMTVARTMKGTKNSVVSAEPDSAARKAALENTVYGH